MTSRLQALSTVHGQTHNVVPQDISAEDRLEHIIGTLPLGALVIDYGCYGWQAANIAVKIGRSDLRQLGVDLHQEPPGRPAGAEFRLLRTIGEPLPPLQADLVVATHVIEHCTDAVSVFGTMIAAVKPEACVYIETPSEHTALLQSNADVEGHHFTNFWDDPTHVRPWPLAALYRLALSWGARPEDLCHADRGGIHCSTALIRRIDPAAPRYRYVSLADVPRGVEAALEHVNRQADRPG